MIKHYKYGTPFNTEAVVMDIPCEEDNCALGIICTSSGFDMKIPVEDSTRIYGLGEANRGINKRGFIYVSDNSDEPNHYEDKRSLYASHNFIIIAAADEKIGLFIDYPGTLSFDICYTEDNMIRISADEAALSLYVIEGDSLIDITKQFRILIGKSYIPPRFAFGFGQSRWGYSKKSDFYEVMRGYRDNHIPIDMLYMDIDYMEAYKDFTFNKEEFENFENFQKDMSGNDIHLIPIIDAGVKIEEGYEVYEEGVAGNYFCKKADGSDFIAAVWPGYTHLPDVLNKDARAWFGRKYQVLTDAGIDGFWNDMNEPALFYTPEGLANLKKKLVAFIENEVEVSDVWAAEAAFAEIKNSPSDYTAFYHSIDGSLIRHDRVHNLYGYYMTKAAKDALDILRPGQRTLLFSRSSYIGMHRYGGVWTGDNKSWWSHLLLNIKMMPSLNMCGFLYSGADIGGFGSDTSRDLLLRWLAFGVFTPLMRNHSAIGTRHQECYEFGQTEDFSHIIRTRYRLIPYIYSEFVKAAMFDDLYFKAFAFEYTDDPIAAEIEDQLLIGNEIMIAPVYEQNKNGRVVYLPEEMLLVSFLQEGIRQQIYPKGYHYISMPLCSVCLFIRKGKCIPLAEPCESTNALDYTSIKLIGYPDSSYELYNDDGYTTDISPAGIQVLYNSF